MWCVYAILFVSTGHGGALSAGSDSARIAECMHREDRVTWSLWRGVRLTRVHQPRLATSCVCAFLSPSRLTNYPELHHTHNAAGTKCTDASILPMADAALSLAEEMACRFVVALNITFPVHPCNNALTHPQASISTATHSGSSRTSYTRCGIVASPNIAAALTMAMSRCPVRPPLPCPTSHLPNTRSRLDAMAPPYPL
jgi:hypothetical protein